MSVSILQFLMEALNSSKQTLKYCNLLINLSKTLALPGYFMILMMIALEVMQIFWTYYLVRAFLSVSVSSKIKHTYDGFSELKSEKK